MIMALFTNEPFSRAILNIVATTTVVGSLVPKPAEEDAQCEVS